jgi:DNA-binding transcriptional LysR family regulator
MAPFAAVVETGSFTQAATRLSITKAVVSQQVTNLEQEVKATLLIRSTRSVTPTEAGREFYLRCRHIIKEAEDAFNLLSQSTEIPTGTLRMAAPLDYGATILTPVVTAFRRAYPSCRLALKLGDHINDVFTEDLDLAIRVGWLSDSSLQARKIGNFQQLVVVSTAYVDSLGLLNRPDDVLEKAEFVANLALTDPITWTFTRASNETEKVRFESGLMLDTSAALLQALKADAGLSVLPDYSVYDALKSGEFRVVLLDWTLRAGGIYVVYPPARLRPAKVTKFVEMLVETEKRRRI